MPETQSTKRARFRSALTLGLMIILLAAGCDSESSPEVPTDGETPSTALDQPDAGARSSTEAPATTAAPSENAGSETTVAANADEGGVDPYIVAAIITVVVLIGAGT